MIGSRLPRKVPHRSTTTASTNSSPGCAAVSASKPAFASSTKVGRANPGISAALFMRTPGAPTWPDYHKDGAKPAKGGQRCLPRNGLAGREWNQSGIDTLEQHRAIFDCCGREALEVILQANVGIEFRAVLMEVQEGAVAAVEGAGRFLLQGGARPQFAQERLQASQRFRTGVPHIGMGSGAG